MRPFRKLAWAELKLVVRDLLTAVSPLAVPALARSAPRPGTSPPTAASSAGRANGLCARRALPGPVTCIARDSTTSRTRAGATASRPARCRTRPRPGGDLITHSRSVTSAQNARRAVRSGGKIEFRDAGSRPYPNDLSGKAPHGGSRQMAFTNYRRRAGSAYSCWNIGAPVCLISFCGWPVRSHERW